MLYSPIANVRDNVQHYVMRGYEQIINPTFSSDTVWTTNTEWTISGGYLTYDGTAGTSAISQTGLTGLVLGKTYRIEINCISNQGAGGNNIYLGSQLIAAPHLEAGTFVKTFVYSGTGSFFIYGRASEVLVLDSVHLYEINTDTPINSLRQGS